MSDASGDRDPFEVVAASFLARLRAGERPSVEEFAERHPELADQIRDLLPAVVMVEQGLSLGAAPDSTALPQRADPGAAPRQIGDFRIVREIGRGGMGVVYEAEQVSLDRRVALKVLPQHAAGDAISLARFHREARASARLHHTNIVPVFEVGQDGAVRYYAMQFIQGQSLDTVIHELRRLRIQSSALQHKTPPPVDSVATEDADRPPVAQSLLTGRFDPKITAAAAPAADASVPGADGAEPVPTASADSSAVMPGGAPLSTVESRRRAFYRGVAHLGRQAASALAHAHARGIIHRDVKPSNLLLDTEGVLWVTDFGLAKVDDIDLTRTGDVLGTLRYMAPERFRGQGDTRADIYALGLTLYELLALRPAFDSPDRVALSEQIKSLDPPRLRSLDARIPRDLETIVLKAIEKDPKARYTSAEAMAGDLGRFLDDQPILARRVGAAERYLRWARRNPVIAVLGGVLTAVLLMASIASLVVAGRMARLARTNQRVAQSERDAKLTAQAAHGQAEAERQKAEGHRERAEQHLYFARIGEAESSLRLLDSITPRTLLDKYLPAPGVPDRRGWEWFYLDQWCRPELRTLTLPVAPETQAVAVSPGGDLVAVACSDPWGVDTKVQQPVPAYLLSIADGTVRHTLAGHKGYVFAVAFRPDGKRLATLGMEGTIRVWDTDSGREVGAIGLGAAVKVPPAWEFAGLAWNPDGRRLATAVGDGLVRIWDSETGAEAGRFAHNARSVGWSPDGRQIASGGEAGLAVRLCDPRDGLPGRTILSHPHTAHAVSWSPDSRRLAALSIDWAGGSTTAELSVWDTTRGERLFRVPDVTELRSVAFSPDGTRVASGGKEGIVRVFDAATGDACTVLLTGSVNVSGLAFSPDGRRLFASGWRLGGVKMYDPDRDPRGHGFRPWLDQLSALSFDRDGLRILGFAWDLGLLTSADPVNGHFQIEQVKNLTNSHDWPRGDFAFSAGGRWFAAPLRTDRKLVVVRDVAQRRNIARLRGTTGTVTALAFLPDGESLAVAGLSGPKGRPAVTIWHVTSGRAIRTFDVPDRVEAFAFSGDGRTLAAGGGRKDIAGSGWAALWDTQAHTRLATRNGMGQVMFLAFHPDGVRLAIADHPESKVHLWDRGAGTFITSPGPRFVGCVAFTPDGKRLAALGNDGNVHLSDARTGDTVLVLRGFGPPPGSGSFTPRLVISPDGSLIAAHNAIGKILNLWDLGRRSGLAAGPGSSETDRPVLLWRRGDPAQARTALTQAMNTLPDDLGRWIDMARLLDRFGAGSESAAALAKAGSLLQGRLSGTPLDPDVEAAAGALAELLPDEGDSRGWTVLEPTAMMSSAGATLKRLPDGSVLASGKYSAFDTYTVDATTDLSAITGLRLEALPDPSLPKSGPGRLPFDGNFAMDTLRLSAIADPRDPAGQPIRLSGARANHSDGNFGMRGVIGAIDADPATAWSIWPLFGRRHQAVFQAAEPFATSAGIQLRVTLSCQVQRQPGRTLGRFRLSVTNRPFPLLEPSLTKIKADGDRHGLTRLGAAYCLHGDWVSAAAVLAPAAARQGAFAIDGFLLALARHRLGRPAEARGDCDRALRRMLNERATDETRDVAIDALATVRGLSLNSAELVLLEALFPADPFVR
jgi:WD40 repeat protein